MVFNPMYFLFFEESDRGVISLALCIDDLLFELEQYGVGGMTLF